MAKKKSSVDTILEEIEKLTVMELSDLVSALEEKFNVSAQAPIAQVAGGAAAGGGVGEEEKSEFDVILQVAGQKKIQVIKAVREITGLGLKDAKTLVDDAPAPVKEGLDEESAEKIKEQLEEQGATIDLK